MLYFTKSVLFTKPSFAAQPNSRADLCGDICFALNRFSTQNNSPLLQYIETPALEADFVT